MPLTPFLSDLLSKQKDVFEFDSIEWNDDIKMLDNLSINNWENYKSFFYLKQYLPKIIFEISGNNPNLILLKNIIKYILGNSLKINSILDLYKSTNVALKYFSIPIKKAYPQGNFADDYADTTTFDLVKWKNTSDRIRLYLTHGFNYNQSLKFATTGWTLDEISDFNRWINYYQSEDHMKYKKAQSHILYDSVKIPTDSLKASIPLSLVDDKKQLTPKEQIEKDIKSLMGRLNSAEKIATNPRLRESLQRMFNGQLDSWLENLHSLKRKLQSSPWIVIAAYREIPTHINVRNKTISDLLYKQSNLSENFEVSYCLRKLAQAVVTPVAQQTAIQPVPTNQVIQQIPVLPQQTNLQNPISNEPSDEESKQTINKIIERLNPKKKETKKIAQQLVPNISNTVKNPQQEIPIVTKTVSTSNETKYAIEDALSNVTIKEVLERLEAVASIFRKREVPRQLAIVDLMMDALNISSYFPTLGEASQKSLDANQYALTRIEEIISKLKGSIMIPKEDQLVLNNTKQKAPGSGVDEKIRNILNQEQKNEQDDLALEQSKNLIKKPEEQIQLQPITEVNQGFAGPQPKIITQPTIKPNSQIIPPNQIPQQAIR